MNWLRDNLKGIMGVIILVLSLIGGVLTFDDRYATSKELVQLEQKVVKTLEEHRKADTVDRLEQRYDSLGDTIIKQKSQMRQYPNDRDLKEDYETTVKEREKVKEKLDKMRSQ
jgi:hypothetical protein